jgi:hypothetical protein
MPNGPSSRTRPINLQTSQTTYKPFTTRAPQDQPTISSPNLPNHTLKSSPEPSANITAHSSRHLVMSSDALPISPAAFAAALEALPLSALHLKAAELRNSLAHLEYSNAQLEPFAHPPQGQEPDSVCAEAIEENVIVMAHMRERLGLLQQEAEKRGLGWGELVGQDGIDQMSVEAAEPGDGPTESSDQALTAEENEDLRTLQRENARSNQRGSTEPLSDESIGEHSAWRDGTFQTGRITNGIVAMDNGINSVQSARQSARNDTNGVNTARGGTLSDEELRRRLEERLSTEEDGSLHL